MKTFTHKERSEVDIRIAQELKNHQDFVYQTNQGLQNLNTTLMSMSLLHEKGQSNFFNQKKELEIGFENLKEIVTKQLSEFLQRMGNLESKCVEIAQKLEDQLDEFSREYLTKESFVSALSPEIQMIESLSKELSERNSYIETQFSKLKSFTDDQVVQVRKEIPSVEEFKPLRKVMSESFDAFQIDFDGLVKEIALLKKAVAYDQKKFENVYTLIERLKAEKE